MLDLISATGKQLAEGGNARQDAATIPLRTDIPAENKSSPASRLFSVPYN
jgi:hypothetical protein